MEKHEATSARQETFRHLKEVRAEAVKHYFLAQEFHAERREILRGLVKDGVSQAEIGRELGVTRQAIQKMMK
ncbi:MAG: TrfB-related DNA-binding protein [Acidimicrobiales bacterium]